MNVPSNSSSFICLPVRKLCDNLKRCRLNPCWVYIRLIVSPTLSFDSSTLLLQWLALMDFFIALLYCNMISSSDLEHIVRINCHTARREGFRKKRDRERERMVHFCSIALMVVHDIYGRIQAF